MTARVKVFPGFERRRFAIENGDGQPSLMHRRLVLERVLPLNATGDFGEWRKGWFVRVVEGELTGLLLGLTPRGLNSIGDTLSGGQRWASVVVHELDEQFRVISAPGMTGLQELPPPR